MKKGLMLALFAVLGLVTFLAGYSISSHTGTEPGYFDAVEAAGYGGGEELEKVEGVTDEMQEYYRSLTDAEE